MYCIFLPGLEENVRPLHFLGKAKLWCLNFKCMHIFEVICFYNYTIDLKRFLFKHILLGETGVE